jgi:hypothetical protein
MFEQLATNLVLSQTTSSVTAFTKPVALAGLTSGQVDISTLSFTFNHTAAATAALDVLIQGSNDQENWLYWHSTGTFSGTASGSQTGVAKGTWTLAGSGTTTEPKTFKGAFGPNTEAYSKALRTAYARFAVVLTVSAGTASAVVSLSVNTTAS